MGREPREYVIRGQIVQLSAGEWRVIVSASVTTRLSPGEPMHETAHVRSMQEAKVEQRLLVRSMAERLQKQGHVIANVETDF
jgi:hypothetical protein